MKPGDLVRYKTIPWGEKKIFIVRRLELRNNWVFVWGIDTPIQANLFEVVSRVGGK